MHFDSKRTTLLIVPAQVGGYPQAGTSGPGYPRLRDSRKAGLRTGSGARQVLDEKGENAVFPRNPAAPIYNY